MANITTTYSNIRKGVFKNVRTCLSGAVSDVGTRVYGAYPLKNLQLPLIVVENGIVNVDNESMTVDKNNSRMVIVNITTYAKQAEMIDTYADAIQAALEAYEDTFESYGMIMSKLGVTDVDSTTFIDTNEQRVHSKTQSITFHIDR